MSYTMQWNESGNQSIRKLRNTDEIVQHKTVSKSKKRITKDIKKYIEKLEKPNHIVGEPCWSEAAVYLVVYCYFFQSLAT